MCFLCGRTSSQRSVTCHKSAWVPSHVRLVLAALACQGIVVLDAHLWWLQLLSCAVAAAVALSHGRFLPITSLGKRPLCHVIVDPQLWAKAGQQPSVLV